MSAKAPSPALRAPSPTRGEGTHPLAASPSFIKGEGNNHFAPSPSPPRGQDNTLPSPLVGEGADARSALTGEGAAGHTFRSPKRRESDNHLVPSTLPSPLVGEGGNARSALTGEGAAGRTLRFAKQLRRTMTDAETRLWHELRAKRFESYKFKRQVPIGKYIADFVCFDHKLIVEIDGSQHEGSATDVVRDKWLNAQGFRVLRLWNREVLLDTNGAMLSILAALEESKSL